MKFNTKAEYVPGKEMVITNYLSRNLLATTDIPDTVKEVESFVDSVQPMRQASDQKLDQLQLTINCS